MTHALTDAERKLEPYITATPELRQEIEQWIKDQRFLSNRRSFTDFDDVDVVPISLEYMTDAR